MSPISICVGLTCIVNCSFIMSFFSFSRHAIMPKSLVMGLGIKYFFLIYVFLLFLILTCALMAPFPGHCFYS